MKHIRLEGNPALRGLAHGEHYREDIRLLAAIRQELLAKYLFNANSREAIIGEQLAVLAREKDLHDEFCGIAKGAGVDHAALLVLNNYTDLRDFAPTDEGCSLFGILGEESVLCGQTWDMHASARPFALHMEIGGDAPAHVLTLTGCLGMAGVNASGVAVLINNLWSDETAAGLAWPALVRGMLLQTTAGAATDYLYQHMPASGRNFLLVGPDGAVNVEVSGRRHEETFRGKRGLVLHTNHYTGALAATQKPLQAASTSERRLRDLRDYFSAGGAYDMESLCRDVLAGGRACSIPIADPGHPDMPMTCGGLVLDMRARRGQAFAGNYAEGDRRDISW